MTYTIIDKKDIEVPILVNVDDFVRYKTNNNRSTYEIPMMYKLLWEAHHNFQCVNVMDPRLKLQYYEDNEWEAEYISEAKKIVTEVWNNFYKRIHARRHTFNCSLV
ncbi:hypothetical protein RhiirA4_463250 [Rhizophagus irregularis]|uniref:Uncharacterized protein n=1 Tax=Rhizophagus irregularis TaxID=588596 RepID=A0A2I1GMK3_9GLOM|nr:hypothetical protein RhiirA4_463250 [Rhizophagus irregularis]